MTVGKNGPKFKESAEPVPAPSDERSDAAKKREAMHGPAMDSEGFPILRPGMGMAIMNGRARMATKEMTMGMLADYLAVQLAKPVKDATGLNGKYDISLFWIPENNGPRAAVPTGPEDNGTNLFAAVQEQRGLKLEPRKGAISVLVVDKVETTPTENQAAMTITS